MCPVGQYKDGGTCKQCSSGCEVSEEPPVVEIGYVVEGVMQINDLVGLLKAASEALTDGGVASQAEHNVLKAAAHTIARAAGVEADAVVTCLGWSDGRKMCLGREGRRAPCGRERQRGDWCGPRGTMRLDRGPALPQKAGT